VRNRLSYITRPLNITDFFSVIPTIVELSLGDYYGWYFTGMFLCFRSFRLFQILKFERFSQPKVHIVLRAMSTSAVNLGPVLAFITIVASFVTGGLMFQSETMFKSPYEAYYLAFITMTTVGYGDLAPKTIYGQVNACFVAMIGIIVISTAVMVVAKTYEHCEEASAFMNKTVQSHLEEQGRSWDDFCIMTVDELYTCVNERFFMENFLVVLEEEGLKPSSGGHRVSSLLVQQENRSKKWGSKPGDNNANSEEVHTIKDRQNSVLNYESYRKSVSFRAQKTKTVKIKSESKGKQKNTKSPPSQLDTIAEINEPKAPKSAQSSFSYDEIDPRLEPRDLASSASLEKTSLSK